MRFDLSAAVKRAEEMVMPWDFSIAVDGQDHPTRPIVVAELEGFNRLKAMAEPDIRAFVAGLFVTPPAIEAWALDVVVAAALAVSAYFHERIKKKSLMLAKDVAAAVAAAEKEGSTSLS